MNKTTILVFQCIKVVSGVIGTSLVFTQKYPIATVAVLALGAAANEIIAHSKNQTNDSTDSLDA